jgi:Family of unknown function (DUF5313)
VTERPARPGPVRWFWYALGGGLPPRYREWVLRDTTAPRWWWRQIVRALVQAVPVGIVVGLLIPGSAGVRVLAVAGGVLVALLYVVAFIDEAVEHRAMKAGYPRGYAKALRDAAETPAGAPTRYPRTDPSPSVTFPAPWTRSGSNGDR